MKDIFTYSARWNTVGLDCSFCKHEKSVEWPNKNRDYACQLHRISLTPTITKDGFKEGEWFCSKFENNGKANVKAINEFESFRGELESNILYGAYGKDGILKEIQFTEL